MNWADERRQEIRKKTIEVLLFLALLCAAGLLANELVEYAFELPEEEYYEDQR